MDLNRFSFMFLTKVTKFIIGKTVNLFYTTGLFLYPLKTSGFLFSGGVERDQWHEMI